MSSDEKISELLSEIEILKARLSQWEIDCAEYQECDREYEAKIKQLLFENAALRGIVADLVQVPAHWAFGRKEETNDAWLVYAMSDPCLKVWRAFGITDGMIREEALRRIAKQPVRTTGEGS